MVLGSCRRWTSSCDEFHKAVLSRNSRLSPCFAIMTCVKRKDRKRCVYRHWQKQCIFKYLYIYIYIRITCVYIYVLHVYIYIYVVEIFLYVHMFFNCFYTPYALEVGISLVTLVLSRLCLSFCLACASSFGEVWHAWWSLLKGFYCQIRYMCRLCTEAVQSVALWTRVTLQVWTCVKYVLKQSSP